MLSKSKFVWASFFPYRDIKVQEIKISQILIFVRFFSDTVIDYLEVLQTLKCKSGSIVFVIYNKIQEW